MKKVTQNKENVKQLPYLNMENTKICNIKY